MEWWELARKLGIFLLGVLIGIAPSLPKLFRRDPTFLTSPNPTVEEIAQALERRAHH